MKVQELRKELKNQFNGTNFSGINTDFSDEQLVTSGVSFFPYGSGLLVPGDKIPKDCVLFLGSDWGTDKDNAEAVKANKPGSTKRKKNITVNNLKDLLIGKDNWGKAFLSNALMGLREENKSNIKPHKAFSDIDYQERCKDFLKYQIEEINPVRIITLGARADKFIRKNCPEKFKNKIHSIPHPCLLHGNIGKRIKKEKNGVKASQEEVLQEIEKIRGKIWAGLR